MIDNNRNDNINDLFQRGKWLEARKRLEREWQREPTNHWLITQLGVTFYEQGQYDDALELFLKSREIVSDCPLTLWNLAGTLDAIGKHTGALSIYTWLLRTNKSPQDDPCWESKTWAAGLKTDCVYRIGACFQHLGKKKKSEQCYHQYLSLLSIGMDGSYSIDDVKRQLQGMRSKAKSGGVETEFRKAVNATLQITGIEPRKGRDAPPEINVRALVTGRRSASKK